MLHGVAKKKKKKIVFELSGIQTITLYLIVSSFNIVTFLIELELLYLFD